MRKWLAKYLSPAPVNFRGACLTSVDFSGRSLRRENFSGADLTMANLRGCDLERVSFNGANLFYTDLSHAVLDYADLSGARISGAKFLGASMLGTTFAGTNLGGELLDRAPGNIHGLRYRPSILVTLTPLNVWIGSECNSRDGWHRATRLGGSMRGHYTGEFYIENAAQILAAHDRYRSDNI